MRLPIYLRPPAGTDTSGPELGSPAHSVRSLPKAAIPLPSSISMYRPHKVSMYRLHNVSIYQPHMYQCIDLTMYQCIDLTKESAGKQICHCGAGVCKFPRGGVRVPRRMEPFPGMGGVQYQLSHALSASCLDSSTFQHRGSQEWRSKPSSQLCSESRLLLCWG